MQSIRKLLPYFYFYLQTIARFRSCCDNNFHRKKDLLKGFLWTRGNVIWVKRKARTKWNVCGFPSVFLLRWQRHALKLYCFIFFCSHTANKTLTWTHSIRRKALCVCVLWVIKTKFGNNLRHFCFQGNLSSKHSHSSTTKTNVNNLRDN